MFTMGSWLVLSVWKISFPIIFLPPSTNQLTHIFKKNDLKHGAASKVSKIYFIEEKLLNAIDKIFSNYEFYLNNAQF